MDGATARLGCTWDLILNKCKNHSGAAAGDSYKGPGLSSKGSHIGDGKAKVENVKRGERMTDYLQRAGRTRRHLKSDGLLKEGQGTPFRELQTLPEE